MKQPLCIFEWFNADFVTFIQCFSTFLKSWNLWNIYEYLAESKRSIILLFLAFSGIPVKKWRNLWVPRHLGWKNIAQISVTLTPKILYLDGIEWNIWRFYLLLLLLLWRQLKLEFEDKYFHNFLNRKKRIRRYHKLLSLSCCARI